MNELAHLERREREDPDSLTYDGRRRLAQLRAYRDRDESGDETEDDE